jgi:hypothetical protein
MSTDLVSRAGLLEAPDAALPSDDTDASSPAPISSSFTSPRNISGARHPTVHAAIAPCDVGRKLVWSTSSFLHSPKYEISIRYAFAPPPPARRHEDVLRLDVAVHELQPVQVP